MLLRLAGGGGTATLEEAARAAGVPLTVVDLAEPAVLEAYERPFVLVRPDGHVAWRGHAPPEPEAARRIIDVVRGAAISIGERKAA